MLLHENKNRLDIKHMAETSNCAFIPDRVAAFEKLLLVTKATRVVVTEAKRRTDLRFLYQRDQTEMHMNSTQPHVTTLQSINNNKTKGILLSPCTRLVRRTAAEVSAAPSRPTPGSWPPPWPSLTRPSPCP